MKRRIMCLLFLWTAITVLASASEAAAWPENADKAKAIAWSKNTGTSKAAALPETAAQTETDWEEHTLSCPQERYGCYLLQMVMMGSFDEYDPEDMLSLRVLSAAYPQLCELDDDDFEHFLAEYGEEEQEVTGEYYEALSNCLLADILTEGVSPEGDGLEEQVLLLFLDPDREENAQEQMKAIREGMTDKMLRRIAEAAQAPEDYIRWLIMEERD